MRRIYIESILSLLFCFITSLFLYEIFVFEINTDDERVLQKYEGLAFQELIDDIAKRDGIELAQQALMKFAQTSHSRVTFYEQSDALPGVQLELWKETLNQPLYVDDDALWFRLSRGTHIYHYQPDTEHQIYQDIQLENDLMWVFFLLGFALYGIAHLFILFRRVKKLHIATEQFSEGNFHYQVETSQHHALGSLNQAFNKMAIKISQLIETNRSLTNAIAHEMRTPVFRIQWQAELLSETVLNENQKIMVSSIIEDTEEMEIMIDELLYYARLDSGRCKPNLEIIDLNAFLEEAKIAWQRETKITITCLSDSHHRYVNAYLYADNVLLKRALDNLVRNAFKFAAEQIIIDVEIVDSAMVISIHDDGPGVSTDLQVQLFEPFFVGNKARNKAKSGHGLGLSIVNKICEQHGATVEVGTSHLLGGAVFTMKFQAGYAD